MKSLCLKTTPKVAYLQTTCYTDLHTPIQTVSFPEQLSTYFHQQRTRKSFWTEMLLSAFTLSQPKRPLSTWHQFRTDASSLSFPLFTKQLAMPTQIHLFFYFPIKISAKNICSMSLFSCPFSDTFNWEWLHPGNLLEIILTSFSHNRWAVKVEMC